MARSPVTALLDQFHNLTPEEAKVFLDLVDPQPEPEPQVKQTRKKRTTKSPKAQSLESVIAKTPKVGADADAAKADAPEVFNGTRCIAKIPGLGVECGDPEDNRVHDKNAGYAGYHPFESSAPFAEKKSRRKGAAASSTQNTEIGSGAALSASGD